MKNLLKTSTFIFTIIILTVFTSCRPDSVLEVEKDLTPQDLEETTAEYPHYHSELCDHVKHLDMDLDNPEKIDFEFPDGTTEERFLLEGDLVFTRAELQQLKEEMNSDLRQYRTYNLVSSPRVITVIGYTGASNALTTKMRTGLSWAIANYNALNLGITFQLSFGTNFSDKDIVVYKVYGSAGGSAGFPSNGNPHKWVTINSGTDAFSTNVNEHVIGHEIGHCIGLRHTDYMNRASCGQNSNEGSTEFGAVNIPGTPTGIDWNSLMLACFDSDENGELGYYDKIALQYLY